MPEIRLLIIEDRDDDALFIVRQFKRAGVAATFARVETADAMQAALDRQAPDVVISDYNMPRFSAEEALAKLRASALDVPFILVSGQVGEETAAALMRAGAHDFVLKSRLARLVPAVQRELREAADRRQHRAAEGALRDSEERFRLLAEHAQDIIFRYRCPPHAGLEYVSPAVRTITGYSPEELYADPSLVFTLVAPEDRDRFRDSWHGQPTSSLRMRWRTRDGRESWIEQRAAAITDPAGELVAVEGILRDISAQVAAEEERTRLERQLHQAERLESVGQLAGGIAHDFNNLLAVITGYAEELEDVTPPGNPAYADIDGILRAARRGAALTRQLLIFSRREASRPETLDLNRLVVETERLLHRTLGEDISLTTRLDPQLPSVTVDRSKIEQVLLNLVMNSRAAMPDGGTLVIGTARLPDDRPPMVQLTVTDTGCGMTPEVGRRAFEPFFTTKGPGEGTGLGLATAYGAVQEAGGQIMLRSSPGVGTTVEVHLPASGQVQPAPDAPVAPHPPRGRGETILVVEDEAGVREIVRRQLHKAGYQVVEADGAVEALGIFAERRDTINAVLTDVIMPGMSGPQMVAELRRVRPDLPVLFMSGYTTTATGAGGALPADAHLIRKPFEGPALLRQINEILPVRVTHGRRPE